MDETTDYDEGEFTVGRPMRWWERWTPLWVWDIYYTWQNGKEICRVCDPEKGGDNDVHREIYQILGIWLATDRLTRREKIELLHEIRSKLKLPDMRNMPRHLPYVGPEE